MAENNTTTSDPGRFQKIKTVTLFDFLLIICLITGAFFSLPVIYAHQPSTVAVYKDNSLYAEYPLCEDREITLRGHEGPMKIQVQGCRVSIISSTCKEQICVKSGHISASFQQLICAPNHVLVEIRSKNKAGKEIDAITQ